MAGIGIGDNRPACGDRAGGLLAFMTALAVRCRGAGAPWRTRVTPRRFRGSDGPLRGWVAIPGRDVSCSGASRARRVYVDDESPKRRIAIRPVLDGQDRGSPGTNTTCFARGASARTGPMPRPLARGRRRDHPANAPLPRRDPGIRPRTAYPAIGISHPRGDGVLLLALEAGGQDLPPADRGRMGVRPWPRGDINGVLLRRRPRAAPPPTALVR